jgi:tetratricopeptide (TPR) repeat protein
MAYLKRGFAFQRDKQFEAALADYNQAVAAAPQMPLAYSIRGYLLMFLGRFDQALADSAQIIALSPGTAADGHVLRGAILAAKHDDTGAVAAYDEALARDPKNLFGYAGRGRVLAELGEEDRALADLNRAAELYPHTLHKSTLRHCYRYQAQTTPHCESQVVDTIDIPSTLTMFGVYQTRGRILFDRGDYARAAADLKQAGHDGDTAVKAALASFAIGNCKDGHDSLDDHESYNKVDRASVIAMHRDFIAKTPCADVLDD